jgi:hypothetical protein
MDIMENAIIVLIHVINVSIYNSAINVLTDIIITKEIVLRVALLILILQIILVVLKFNIAKSIIIKIAYHVA